MGNKTSTPKIIASGNPECIQFELTTFFILKVTDSKESIIINDPYQNELRNRLHMISDFLYHFLSFNHLLSIFNENFGKVDIKINEIQEKFHE